MTRTISQKAINTHNKIMKYIVSSFPQIKGNIHLQHYERYFSLKKRNSMFVIPKGQDALKWLHEWARVELSDIPIIYHKDVDGRVIFTSLNKEKLIKARQRLINTIPELYCQVIHKTSISELVLSASNFNVNLKNTKRKSQLQNKSYFKLIEIDKSFLRANWAAQIIKEAEFFDGDKFFSKLSNSIKVEGFRYDMHSSIFGLATILLWYLGGKKLSYPNLLDQLNILRYDLYKESPEAFRKFANRIGLTKYSKVGRKR